MKKDNFMVSEYGRLEKIYPRLCLLLSVKQKTIQSNFCNGMQWTPINHQIP